MFALKISCLPWSSLKPAGNFVRGTYKHRRTTMFELYGLFEYQWSVCFVNEFMARG